MQSMKTLDWHGISGHRYSARQLLKVGDFTNNSSVSVMAMLRQLTMLAAPAAWQRSLLRAVRERSKHSL